MVKIYKDANYALVVDINNVKKYPVSGRHFPIYDGNRNMFAIDGFLRDTPILDIKKRKWWRLFKSSRIRRSNRRFFR